MNRSKMTASRIILMPTLALLLLTACTETGLDDTLFDIQVNETNTGKNYVSSRGILKSEFLYNHGVGYSYNATNGSFCDIENVRCQVINRAMLDYYNDDADEELLVVDYRNEWESDHSVSHSFVEYIQNTNFQAVGDAEILLLAGGSVSSEASIFEDGTIDKYIITSRERVAAANYRLNLYAVKEEAKRHPDLLTASFREAVEHLKGCGDNNWELPVDSFIDLYGTHIITDATLGASLNVDVQITAQDYRTIEDKNVNLDVDIIGGLYKHKEEVEERSEIYKHLQDSKCIISASGGNVSIIDRLVSMNLYQIGALDENAIADWRTSVTFVDGGTGDNSELIDMEVTPIWELIPDQRVADLVRIRVEGGVDDMIAQFGNRNFINASFDIPTGNVSYYKGGNTLTTVQNPDMVDVICAGRHIAAICREWVPSISSSEKVTVIYPIYEGRIKTTSGICDYKGTKYQVEWTGREMLAYEMGKSSGNGKTVYLLAGVPSFDKYENITYQEAKLMPEVEMAFPILPDGSFNTGCKTFSVFKHFGNYYLKDNNQEENGVQNWNYVTKLPEEAGLYSKYFDNSYKNRMCRDASYVYVYNPFEAKVK